MWPAPPTQPTTPTQPSGPRTGPERPPNPSQPTPPPGAPGRALRVAGLAVLAFVAFADTALAANTGGSMPYSAWLTTFRSSVSGEVAMTIAVVCIVAGVGGWVAGGEMTGMLMYLVRAVAGLAIVIGAVAFLGTISAGGAVLPPDVAAAFGR